MSLTSYTTRDIAELRNYLVSLLDKIIEQYDMTGWTDRNESDLGMLYLEIAAGLTDMMNYYIDKQALENYLPTATIEKNIRRIISLVDYKIRGPIPSMTSVAFTLERHMDFDFTIPKYFQVSYSRPQGNIYYATIQDVLVPAGKTTVKADVIQGIVKNIHMTTADLMRNREITLEDTNIAVGTVRVIINDEEWRAVDDVLVEDVFGKKFSTYVDTDGNTVVEFGYSWRDFAPDSPTAPVLIKYISTEGAHGVVSAGKIDTIESFLKVNDYVLSSMISVTNLYDAKIGSDGEDIETARILAPYVWHSQRRITTNEDYKNFFENETGVLKAKVIDWKTEDSRYITTPYQVSAYILPTGSEYIPTDELLGKLKNAITPYMWCSMQIAVMPPIIHDIDISIEVETGTRVYNREGLLRELTDLYSMYFDKTRRSFGEKFTIGDIENIARQSTLVDAVTVFEPTSIIELQPLEFPRLRNLDISIVGAVL